MKDNKQFKKKLIRRSFELSRRVINLVNKFPNKRSARVIADQLLRAITSVGANIIEAQAGSSKRDFINFLTYALKSSNETKFWLALSKDVEAKLLKDIDVLLKETDELAKILGSSLLTLKGKNEL